MRWLALATLVLVAYGTGFAAQQLGLPPTGARTAFLGWCQRHRAMCPLGDRSEDADAGKWFRARSAATVDDEVAARLAALGYLEGYEAAPSQVGVTVNRADAFAGLNLYNSGHGPEAVLMDMAGQVLHRWNHSFESAFPNEETQEPTRQWWRRVHLYPDGDLLAIFEGLGIIRIGPDSSLRWAIAGGFHHDAYVTRDGTIYTLLREERVVPWIDPEREVLEDWIVQLSEDGQELRRVSMLEAMRNSTHAPLLSTVQRYAEYFHTNTIEVLEGAHPAGDLIPAHRDVLVSIRNLHTVAVIDLESERAT